jgi:hypothetical protein
MSLYFNVLLSSIKNKKLKNGLYRDDAAKELVYAINSEIVGRISYSELAASEDPHLEVSKMIKGVRDYE